MANRSYLYSTNIAPRPDAVDQGRKLIGISEYRYDIPLVFKLLLSGSPRTCPSSIWDCDDDMALLGDYDAGLANLEAFLAQIKNPAAQPLIAQALDFLRKPENRNPYFVLECGEIFEMQDPGPGEQNLQLLHSIQNLQPEIDAALQSLAAPPPVPAQPQKPAGFLARMFGLAPPPAPSRPAPDSLQAFQRLGLGHWSNYLYFDFSPQKPKEPQQPPSP